MNSTPGKKSDLLERLAIETRLATSRVYQLDDATDLESVGLPQGCKLHLKREDLSKVHSYKWRGSFNKIASMVEAGFNGSMVAASAGNHALALAYHGKELGVPVTVVMPVVAPLAKVDKCRVSRFFDVGSKRTNELTGGD